MRLEGGTGLDVAIEGIASRLSAAGANPNPAALRALREEIEQGRPQDRGSPR
jgi:hypothetical protein